MGWFKRIQDGITTKSTEKKEIPEGAWHQCVNCKTVVTSQQHADRMHVCNYCGHHDRIGSEEYFALLFDEGKYSEVAPKIESEDPLKFSDTKTYASRLELLPKRKRASLTRCARPPVIWKAFLW
jgi:acetyl-CoA carboxylase carboxyl transferase subunit beta